MPIKPGRLEPGMTLGLVAPASAPSSTEVIEKGVAVIREYGYKVRLARNAKARKGFIAGSDSQRTADIHDMFRDPAIHAVICLRGGYGTPRILNDLDYALIRSNPKIFIGYSDITGLHLAFLKKSNLVTFHGPMVTSNFAQVDAREYSLGSLLRMISKAEPFGSILAGSGIKRAETLRKGRVTAPLVGGNLCMVDTLLGTPWEINTKGKIVFLEEVGETNYRVDRLFTHLLNSGKLQQAAGICLGNFSDCEIKPSAGGYPTQTMLEIFEDRLAPLKIPVAYGFPFGHEALTATLPQGIPATLDATRGDLIIEESAVK